MTEAIRELVRYVNPIFDSARWKGFEFRADDIVISTPAKCGTTWTQMIVALLVFQEPELPAPLSKLSPWVDMRTRARRDVFADLASQSHRRFIKSHTPLPGLPLAEGVTYICVGRDPRDVALSMRDHMNNIDFGVFFAAVAEAAAIDGVDLSSIPMPEGTPVGAPDERDAFWQWVLDDSPAVVNSGLLATLHHLQSFWEARATQKVVMLHYKDLKVDLEGQMRGLADRLGIAVPEARWPSLVRAASFDEMRRNPTATMPNSDTGFWRDNDNFFRKARIGDWREMLDNDADRRRYDERAAALAPRELLRWVHRS